MTKINEYFFGSEEVSLSDGLFFYGCTAVIALVGIPFVIDLFL